MDPVEPGDQLLRIAEEWGRLSAFLGSSPQLRAAREAARAKVGPTPATEIYREHSVSLHRYGTGRPRKGRRPLLIVPSPVNQWWVMDLLPGESFTAAMLERGHDVWMLRWGEPNPGQARLGLGEYLGTYLDRAVRRVLAMTGAERLDLAGYCLGGTFSLLYACLEAGTRVGRLVTMVAPVAFRDHGLLSWWSRPEHFDVDKVVDTYGNVPASFFSASFPWLAPTSSLKKVKALYERRSDPDFLTSFMALDIWMTENTAFPGQVYRELIRHGYQEDRLVARGAWPLGRDEARLARLRAPVLALAAQYDHVAPPASCTRLAELAPGARVESGVLPTGHLGIALGKDILGKPTPAYWDRIATWLARPA